jgi:hypothetical protein
MEAGIETLLGAVSSSALEYARLLKALTFGKVYGIF